MEILEFTNYVIMLISATSAVLIFNLWYIFIRKSNNYYINLSIVGNKYIENDLNKDYGLLFISAALFSWVFIGLAKILLNGAIEILTVSIISALNSIFFLFSTLYLKHSTEFIKIKKRRTENIFIFIFIITLLFTFISFFFIPILISFPDFLLSILTALIFGYSLANTFWQRKLKVVSVFSIITIALLVSTQMEVKNYLYKNNFIEYVPLITLYSKISFIFIICFLAYSWAQENLNIVNSKIENLILKVDELKVSIDKQKSAADDAWKDIALNASHRLGIPVNRIHLYNTMAIKLLRNKKWDGAVLKLIEIDEFIQDAKRVLKDFQATGVNNELRLNKTDIIKLIHSVIKGFKDEGLEIKVINKSKKMIPIHNSDNKRKDLIISFIEDESIEMLIDHDKIKDCFNELISNSTHFFDKPAKMITIELELIENSNDDDSKKWLKIIYEDNGLGIETEKKKWIFEHFKSTYVHGSGLGMCIVKKYIELHSGTIFEDGVFGKGARFEIMIPYKMNI